MEMEMEMQTTGSERERKSDVTSSSASASASSSSSSLPATATATVPGPVPPSQHPPAASFFSQPMSWFHRALHEPTRLRRPVDSSPSGLAVDASASSRTDSGRAIAPLSPRSPSLAMPTSPPAPSSPQASQVPPAPSSAFSSSAALTSATSSSSFMTTTLSTSTATPARTGLTLANLEEMGSGEGEVSIPDDEGDYDLDVTAPPADYLDDADQVDIEDGQRAVRLECSAYESDASTEVGIVSSVGSMPNAMPFARSRAHPSIASTAMSSSAGANKRPTLAARGALAAHTPTPQSPPDTEYTRPIKFNWRTFSAFVGPGWLMSIAYLDPGNLEGDLQAGALAGYQLLWVLLVATCMGTYLQVLACRLGVTTGKNLAQLCRQEYPHYLRMIIWIMMELVIIGTDIQEILGSAIAFRVLFGLPLWAGALITAVDTFSFLGIHYFGVRKLEHFFALLIFIMLLCFFVNFGYTTPSASGIASGFIPSLRSYAVLQAVSLVGSIIMPHNMFLHSALVQSRKIERARPYKIRQANFYFSIETTLAVAVSFAINLAVVCTFARGFFREECAVDGLAYINGACSDEIGLSRAGDVLSGLLGSSSSIIWAIGLLASGQSATMTGTYTGQFVMSGFLDLHLKPFQRIALTRCVAIIPAIAVALSAAGDDHKVDLASQWINVFMSVQVPFAVLPLLHFTSSTQLMGRFANTVWMVALGWLITSLVVSINLYLLMTFVFDPDGMFPQTPAALAVFFLVFAVYACCVALVVRQDALLLIAWLRTRCAPRGASGAAASGDDQAAGTPSLPPPPPPPHAATPAMAVGPSGSAAAAHPVAVPGDVEGDKRATTAIVKPLVHLAA